jgi:hypothetical protein
MLNRDFINHEVGKPYWGIMYDLNFLLGKYAYLENTEQFEKCMEIIEEFHKKFGDKLEEPLKEYAELCYEYVEKNDEIDSTLNKEYCVECPDSCCNLRSTAFFTFGDLVRIRYLIGTWGCPDDLWDHEVELNKKCLFLTDKGCEFTRKTRPLMCLNTICTDWGILVPDEIFENEEEEKEYKLNGRMSNIYQREMARLVLEKVYDVRLR